LNENGHSVSIRSFFPFLGLAPYALDENGRIVFFFVAGLGRFKNSKISVGNSPTTAVEIGKGGHRWI
jgi:hypothetical protein